MSKIDNKTAPFIMTVNPPENIDENGPTNEIRFSIENASTPFGRIRSDDLEKITGLGELDSRQPVLVPVSDLTLLLLCDYVHSDSHSNLRDASCSFDFFEYTISKPLTKNLYHGFEILRSQLGDGVPLRLHDLARSMKVESELVQELGKAMGIEKVPF